MGAYWRPARRAASCSPCGGLHGDLTFAVTKLARGTALNEMREISERMQIRASTLKDPCLQPSIVPDWQKLNGRVMAERQLEFEDLVARNLSSFRRFAMHRMRNTEDAEDAVQDALLSAFKNIGQFEGRAQMSTWLMSIVANAIRMQLRRRPRSHMVSLEDSPEKYQWTISQMLADRRPTPEESVEQWQLCQLVTRMIGGLPRSQRVTLRLMCDGFSIKKTAEALGVPVGTVKARLARGRAKLVERFHKATRATISRMSSFNSKNRRKPYSSRRVGLMMGQVQARF